MDMATASNNNTTLHGGTSYVEWGPIFAGTAIACAVSLILLQFGQAVGLSIPERFDDSYTAAKVLAIGIWLLWVQLMASMSGGYVAGRLRAPWANASASESEIRDGMHGLLVWATSTVLAVGAAAFLAALGTMALEYGVDAAQNVQAEAGGVSESMARRYGIIFGFSAVASSIVSALTAYWMGTLGGDHRDQEPDLSRFSFRKRTSKSKKSST